MNDRLILEFLGIDLISNIANDIGNSLDRLGQRFERLGALADSNYRGMVNANRAANVQMQAQLAEMSAVETAQDGEIASARASMTARLAELDAVQATNLKALADVKDDVRYRDIKGQFIQTESLRAGMAAQIEMDKVTMESERITLEANLTKMESYAAVTAAQDKQVAAQLAADKAARASALETQRVITEANQARIASAIRAGTALAAVGAVSIAAAAAIGVGMLAAANHAANFQAQMTLIETQAGAPRKGETVGGIVQSVGEIEKIQSALLDLLPIYGVTGEEAAKAMYHIESLGFRGDRALEILKAGLMGAKVGMADVEATTNVLGTVMASGISGIKDASDAMAQLDAFVGVGNMRMEDLNSAFTSGIVGAAQNFGVSLKDVGAALATLTDLGMPAAMAGTRLRMSMTLLGAPAKAATKILATLGLTEEEATAETTKMWRNLEDAGVSVTKIGETMRTKGLIPALQLMKDAMTEAGLNADQQAAVISRAFGGGRSGAAIMTLIQNMDRLQNRFGQISHLQQTFEERWAETQSTMKFQMEALHGAFDKFVIHLGFVFMPTVLQWINGLKNVISGIATWVGQNEKLLASLAPLLMMIFAGVGAFLLIAGGAMIAGGAIAALGSLALPVVAAIAGMLVVVSLLTTHWGAFVSFWHSELEPMWTTFSRIVNAVWTTIALAWQTVVPGLIKAFAPLQEALTRQGGLWDIIKKQAGDFLAAVKTVVNSPEFAYFVAWLAVYVPAAVGIMVRAIIVGIDALVTAMHLATGIQKATQQLMIGDAKGAAKTLKETWDQNSRDRVQSERDANALTLAEMGIFDPKLAKKTRDLADMIKIGIDDALNPLPTTTKASLGKINTILDDMRPNTRERARLLGEDTALGVKHGIDARAGEIAASAASMVDVALSAARSHARSYSPSMLFAEKLGVPIAQGVALGITSGAPGATTAMTGLLGSLVNLTPKVGAMPGYSGSASTAQSEQEKKQQDISDYLARIADATETVADSCQAEHQTGQKPNSDRQALLSQFVAALDLKGVQTSNRGVRGYSP